MSHRLFYSLALGGCLAFWVAVVLLLGTLLAW